jgi:hypothetical protein
MSKNMLVWEVEPGAAVVDDDADIIQGKAVADGIVWKKLVAPLVVLTCVKVQHYLIVACSEH